ncbi:hypothetical protein F511_29098 [Dorcoceras hygrometricum]|uniref:Dystroglycan-like n=1 Tax=Dorcoceras hygrometricum TaxID=472368 RepID=A0A2Z7CMY2_9LAMI|nr:hypothetical protein F511_29098 [Dorcoceras hygrometricum]
MASSLYSNAQHVDFESVLGMDDPGMVSMFEALVASGLRGFLGCPAIVYEDALVDFFENASVRNGVVISTVGGQLVEFSEKLFAETHSLRLSTFEMASSLYSNAQHVDFESVLGMDDPGMVSMFEALVASGLRGFLGCPAIVYEDALVDFFENASVRNGVVFSTVGGQLVEISEKLFAETFELPVDGRKNQMKMPFRLLCDIVAKAISVKAGSFNAITVEKFSLLTVVVCGVKMNWANLKKLASINFEEMYRKEEQVLSWGETESPQEAIQRKFYILLKYRTILVWKFLEAWRVNFAPGQGCSAVDIQVIELLSDLYLYFLEELAKEARNIGLTWTKPGCSKIFEGSPRDRGAVIARSNSNTRSLCWIRRMLLVDGLWAVELCADQWVKIPKRIISTEVPRQRQYDDTLPTMSVFFKLLRKRWADVCVEVVEFCASPRLLPIGSTQFCRSLQLAEPVSSFAPSCSSVFALRFSQFCSVFIDLSLFNWLPSTDISEFLSSIALDRTILRSVQRSQDSFAVAPSVQLSLEQHESSSSSDSSSSLHFDQTDIDATASSRPPISPDFSAALADFQAALSEQMFAFQSEISSRMHKIEKSNASIFQGLADVRQVVDAVNAKVDIMAKRLNDIQKDAEATKEALSHQLLEFQRAVLTKRGKVAAEDFKSLAKVYIMAKRLNDIQKDAEATKEALSHQLLEFQSSAQENHNVIHAQLRLADVRQVVDAVYAKVYIMAKRLNDIQKDAEATKEALSHQLLEFQSSAQENHNVIHAQLSELVDYIHRGSADKKGESGSRGLQKPANTQKEGSAVTPSFEQRVQMAQRRIVQTVLDADANRESQEAAERDRERRRKEARSLKRRRKD